jgi:flagellar protein FlaJ
MSEEPKKRRLDIQIPNIHVVGYRILSDYPSRFFPLTSMVRESMARAQMRMSHIVYISSMFFWSIVALFSTLAVATPLILAFDVLLNLRLQTIQLAEYIIGLPLVAFAVVMGVFLYYPYYKADNLKSELDRNIIYIVNYMGILSGAGVTIEDIFNSLAETGEIYKVSNSASSIIRDVGLLGKDIITAIDSESQITPSRKYSKLLVGLLGITRSGGDLRQYFLDTAEREIEIRKRELTGILNNLNLAAEIYSVLGIAFPIILIVLLSLMGMFGGDIGGGLGPVQIMTVMTYILFPLLSIGVIILIDGMTSKW